MDALIIENDMPTAQKLKAIIEKEEYTCTISSEHKSVYKLIEKAPFHLVLLDMDLPDADGFEILDKIRYQYDSCQLPVIVLSTQTNDDFIRKLIDLGANDFVQKPFNYTLLQLKIRNFLRSQQAFTQLNQNEKKLIKNVGIKNSILNSSRDCIKVLDLQGNLLSMNKGGQKLLEIEDIESFYQKSWIKFWKGKDNENAQIAINKAKKGGIGYFEGYCPTMKNTPKWWGIIISPIFDQNGKVQQLLSVSRDITLQKKNEHDLLESEEKYRKVFEKGLSAVIVADDKGNYIAANKAAAKLFGYSVKELTQMNVKDLSTSIQPNAAERYKRYLEKGEETGEFDFVNKKGDKKIALYRAIHIGPDFNLSMLFDITERKKTEQALIESEEKYKRLVNNTITMIAEVNTKTLDIMNCNPAFAKSLDKNVKDVIGQNIAKFYPDGTAQKRIEIIEKALKENKVQLFEDTQNGRYYLNNFIPYKSENLNYIQIVTYDITDSKINQTLKESEEALQLANERYQNAQEIGKVGNWEYNIKTRTFMASKQIMRIFGFPTNHKTLEIADIENCIVETERERVRQATIDLMEKDTSYNVEYEIIQRNTNAKRNILSIAQLVKDEKGNPEKLSGVIQDITERKIIEEAFKEQHIYLEKLNNSLVNVVFTVRMSDRKIIYVNNSIQTIFGYSIDDCINNNTKFLYPNEDSYQEFGKKLQNAIKSNKEFLRTEHKLRRKNGEEFPAEITTTFLKENNQIKEVISIITDITERQKAEDALKESEERYRELNASKDKFFSIISHDLKNPFNAILGFSDLALENIKKKEYDNIYKYCEIINRTTKQGFNLLNNLLQWSQLQTGKINFNPNEINYSEIVENTINLMTANSEEKNIDLSMDISQKLMVFADKYMLETIIRNLLSNAIKFTKNNGLVKLSVQKQKDKILTVVEDNGVGINKSDIGKLFKIERSFSTLGTNEEKGTGLGLILCKEFVEKHGGEIWVESKVNKGTKFSFTLKNKT